MTDDLASRFRLTSAGALREPGHRFRRVGLRAVIADLNRTGRRADVPGEAVAEGFTWDARDVASDRWWPQGITTSADAYGHDATAGTFDGRDVLLTSWYAHGRVARRLLGSRITVVVDIDGAAPAYRHVLLVEPVKVGPMHVLKPVRVHAGGIVWYGDHLFVAGSGAGIRVFRLDDITRVRNRVHSRGYRYVLPQATTYVAEQDPDHAPLTYSFLSLDRGEHVDSLVAGEYGTKDSASHRLVRYPLDRDTQLLRGDERGRSTALELHDGQPRMQGATLVGDTWVVTASAGEGRAGDLWVGRPGHLRKHRGVLPTGPEDVAHWPQRGQVWSLTEWPGRRWVFGVDVDPWVTPAPPDRPAPAGR
ncbi:hypothetical protein [Aeromicrobium fastidiosum]|uniref:Uncharacterized protein n=1 Tax=Aeromicrobium fastidiosum TaxID=52699 RepID=A0A641ARL0_9ACTN|nr:hypothetical protein [Aeromicrobium fastidiosum]KAA1380579.1 hypothetical protein ESP62_005220 [Aeromicrobium fastidiosum]MBP2390177.1 hypothetical protein [Aeromicrobium fastidiosum]